MDSTDSLDNLISDSGVEFKQCPRCEIVWDSCNSFLSDPEVRMIGYQASFRNLTEGLFYFNHSCKTTMAISVNDFESLHEGPIYSERKTMQDECPGHCLHKSNLEPCPAECECAFVRDIVQIIINWKKDDL